ncbi:MAG: right-handed parallel beta-helix repeat-containing protein [Planctomycetota bacterium]
MIRNHLARSTSRLAVTPILLAGLVLGGAIGLLVAAGPLNPPAGPVASSYKTLTEVEPRIAITALNTPPSATAMVRISQPGSYYLTGNITASAGKHGIEIGVTGDVSIDLSGLSIIGDGVSNTSGIASSGAGIRALANGTVRTFGGIGVSITGATCRLDNLNAIGNLGGGVTAGNGVVLRGCVATGNSVSGFNLGPGSIAVDCVAVANQGLGFSANAGSSLTNCTSRSNTSTGIFASSVGGTVTGCTAEFNGADGITGGTGWHIVNCNASLNTGSGIVATNGLVTHCSTHGNGLDGIKATNSCTILANQCTNINSVLGAAGIHTTGTDNRIEGNNCTSALRGIQVDAAGCFIVRNTCSGNGTNWVIAAGNSLGPIVVAGINAGAINTNGAVAGTLVSTDPNANFSY